ncbi:Abortive phage infection protein [Pseudomonas jessenii]|uniref:hypothetical protein n=1 Tax=Pseudomonas jessenii TaxID=77298 RepID=UPI0039E13A0F
MLKIDECVFHLSPIQSDLLAQGFFMAVLRTDIGNFDMPWGNGQIHSVSVIPKTTARMGIKDCTLHVPEADHRFCATGWIYEGAEEDLDYPANVVFLKTKMDDVIEFNKGNHEFLLSPKQAAQLCLELADSASSLGTRVWKIWDKRIEWAAQKAMLEGGISDSSKNELSQYLKEYMFTPGSVIK